MEPNFINLFRQTIILSPYQTAREITIRPSYYPILKIEEEERLIGVSGGVIPIMSVKPDKDVNLPVIENTYYIAPKDIKYMFLDRKDVLTICDAEVFGCSIIVRTLMQ